MLFSGFLRDDMFSSPIPTIVSLLYGVVVCKER